MTLTHVDSATESVHDTFPINGTDYIEMYVGNAKQSAMYYQASFGYELIAYRGPETGVRDRVSYLLVQNKIRLLLTSALGPDGAIADHVRRHGDGVRDIALWVDDTRDAYEKAVERGAEPNEAPRTLRDDNGEVVVASFKIYGDTIHSLVERKNYRGPFLPGFQPRKSNRRVEPTGLLHVDHCVANVELGK